MTNALATLSLISTVGAGLLGLALAYFVRRTYLAEAKVTSLEDDLDEALDLLARRENAQDYLRRGRLAADADLDPADVWGVLLDPADADASGPPGDDRSP